MGKKSLYKSLLASVQEVSQSSDIQYFNEEFIESNREKAAPLANFFALNTGEAIVLSFFIHAYFKDLNTNKEAIINQFGKDISAMADIEEIIHMLADRKLVYLTGSSKRFKKHFKSVNINPKVIMAMSDEDATLLEFKPVSNFSDFLLDISELIKQRSYENITTLKLLEEVLRLMDINGSLEEVKWLKRQKKLMGEDLLVFIAICIEQITGEEMIDLDKVISDVFDSASDKMRFRQNMKNNKSVLYNENYITNTGSLFGNMNYVQLSDETLDNILQDMKAVVKKCFTPRMGQIIEAENIQEEKLFYNEKEKQQIFTLKNVLNEVQYQKILSKMKTSNMRGGFTVLMYGFPGTGKTSTVKSIARETGRNIYMIEIPKINSKWVGESEKNLSKVFEEYRRARKQFEKDPILLFNEADAILGKRINSHNSVDKMNNTLQNILLQELEDFEGIFIATTNLPDHLDAAFDRRLLYKIEFKKPESAIRFEIMKTSFPHLNDDIIQLINNNFHLTGGQIQNIKKKLLVKNLLHDQINFEEEIISLCEDENILRGNTRPIIGFQQR